MEKLGAKFCIDLNIEFLTWVVGTYLRDAKRNEVERATHAGVAGFDVGGDKIWSTWAFGISKKFDQPACRSESKCEVYNRVSCS